MRKTELLEKYNALVVADVEGEKARNDICLCLRCARLVTNADVDDLCVDSNETTRQAHIQRMKKAFNCPTAQRLYEACVDGDVATPVTRCPLYIPKSE